MQTSGPQTLLVLKGLPCCGKSTLADALSKDLRWPVADKDDSRDCLAGLRQDSGADLNALSYELMLRFAARQLANGLSVIVDCPLSRQELAERLAQLSQKYEAQFLVLELIMKDESLWRERLEKRAAQEADTEKHHKPASWEALQKLIDRYSQSHLWTSNKSSSSGPVLSVKYEHLQLDMSSISIEEAIKAARGWLIAQLNCKFQALECNRHECMTGGNAI